MGLEPWALLDLLVPSMMLASDKDHGKVNKPARFCQMRLEGWIMRRPHGECAKMI